MLSTGGEEGRGNGWRRRVCVLVGRGGAKADSRWSSLVVRSTRSSAYTSKKQRGNQLIN